jgi:hypothetical protein
MLELHAQSLHDSSYVSCYGNQMVNELFAKGIVAALHVVLRSRWLGCHPVVVLYKPDVQNVVGGCQPCIMPLYTAAVQLIHN